MGWPQRERRGRFSAQPELGAVLGMGPSLHAIFDGITAAGANIADLSGNGNTGTSNSLGGRLLGPDRKRLPTQCGVTWPSGLLNTLDELTLEIVARFTGAAGYTVRAGTTATGCFWAFQQASAVLTWSQTQAGAIVATSPAGTVACETNRFTHTLVTRASRANGGAVRIYLEGHEAYGLAPGVASAVGAQTPTVGAVTGTVMAMFAGYPSVATAAQAKYLARRRLGLV
jgi:hypothetical protein